MCAQRGEKKCSYTLSLTLEIDGVRDQGQTPAALPPEKIIDTPSAGGLMRPRDGLNGCGNSRLPPPPPHWELIPGPSSP
jgi:hypothetical protein